jgi:hypothetical protein
MLTLQQVAQLGLGQDSVAGWIMQIVFYGIFVIFMFYGQHTISPKVTSAMDLER